VMMKKKTHEQEGTHHHNNQKPSDNKEHIDMPDTQDPGNQVTLSENAADSEESSSDKVVAEVKAIEEKLAEMQDKYIRLSAEFDNYRKRTLREKMELSKYASEDMLLKIIPLMDDFERALQHMDTSTDSGAMKNGIDLIYLKFSEFLKQNGIKEIEALNSDFNVDLHEAVSKVHVAENDLKGKVVDVVLKGYYLQDKVLRFSKVVVGE
jgi:molecular chaperone GrpE